MDGCEWMWPPSVISNLKQKKTKNNWTNNPNRFLFCDIIIETTIQWCFNIRVLAQQFQHTELVEAHIFPATILTMANRYSWEWFTTTHSKSVVSPCCMTKQIHRGCKRREVSIFFFFLFKKWKRKFWLYKETALQGVSPPMTVRASMLLLAHKERH